MKGTLLSLLSSTVESAKKEENHEENRDFFGDIILCHREWLFNDGDFQDT